VIAFHSVQHAHASPYTFIISVLCTRKCILHVGRITLSIPGTYLPSASSHLGPLGLDLTPRVRPPFPGVRCHLSSFTFFWTTRTGETSFAPSVSVVLLAHHHSSKSPYSWWMLKIWVSYLTYAWNPEHDLPFHPMFLNDNSLPF
jgi:hypothetical protein